MRIRRKRQTDLSGSGEEDEVVLHGDSNGFVFLVTLDLHQPSLKGPSAFSQRCAAVCWSIEKYKERGQR